MNNRIKFRINLWLAKASKFPIPAGALGLLLAGLLVGCGETGDSEPSSEDVTTVNLRDIYQPATESVTPVPIQLDNLELVPAEPVMELQLPAGADQNVASGRPVTSSDPVPIIGELEWITNGKVESADGRTVELAPGLQWVQIDLGDAHEIFTIHVWHAYHVSAAYKDVVVQISELEEFQNEDGTSADHVVTVFNSDHDGSSGLGLPVGTDPAYVETMYGRVIEVDGVKGRYIRLYSDGNTNDPVNHYDEVMVYARVVDAGDDAGETSQ